MNLSRGFISLGIGLAIAIVAATVLGGGAWWVTQNSSTTPVATIDPTSLSPSEKEYASEDFSISGTAEGISKVLVVVGAVGYPSDLDAYVRSLHDIQSIKEGVFPVEQGRWVAKFNRPNPDLYSGATFEVRVYDVSGKTIQWTGPGGYEESVGKCEPSCTGVEPLVTAPLKVY